MTFGAAVHVLVGLERMKCSCGSCCPAFFRSADDNPACQCRRKFMCVNGTNRRLCI